MGHGLIWLPYPHPPPSQMCLTWYRTRTDPSGQTHLHTGWLISVSLKLLGHADITLFTHFITDQDVLSWSNDPFTLIALQTTLRFFPSRILPLLTN